ncbi:phage Holliday junction resolvase [Streptococcus pneumoniae]|nr:phage Holliday junction resolvase [Streptococcus pneumoniae]
MTDAGIWTDDNHKVIKKLSFVYGGLSEEKGHYRLEFEGEHHISITQNSVDKLLKVLDIIGEDGK